MSKPRKWGTRPLERSKEQVERNRIPNAKEGYESSTMTDRELVAKAEALCERFADALGYKTNSNIPFHASENSRRQGIWQLARIAFEELQQTDIDDAVTIVSELDREAAPAFVAEGI